MQQGEEAGALVATVDAASWRSALAAQAAARTQPRKGRSSRVGTITTTDGTEIFCKDWGSAQPVVFSHGWPLNADAWDD
jgi:hypothetical protein